MAWLDGITRAVLAAYALLSGLKLLSYSYNIIRAPFPLELREGAILSTTHLLLAGKNPFAAENLPQYLNGYGIVYNLTAVPLARWLGDTFITHRLLTGFYIYLAVALLVAVTIRKGGAPLFAIAAGLCVLANQLYSVTPLTRPDGLGLLLYLAAALLPWDQNFSKPSLVASAVLSVLAFFTKLYFFLSVVYVAAYLFLRVSKRLAVAYAAGVAALLLAASLVVVRFYPFYFYDTFFMAVYQPIYLFWYMLWQFRHWGYLYAGMLAIVLLVAAEAVKPALQRLRSFHWRQIPQAFNLRQLNQPLLRFEVGFPLTALILAVLTMVFKLGGHNGSKMVYLFQLISPFLAILVVLWLRRLSWFKFAASLFMLLALATNQRQIGIRPFNLQLSPDALINNPTRYQPNWVKMERIVRGHNQILNHPLIAGLLIQQNKPLTDNGHTEFFHANGIPKNILLPPTEQIYEIDRAFGAGVLQKVRSRSFDLIVTGRNGYAFVNRETLDQYYRFDQSIDLYAIQNREHFILDIWLPRPSAALPDKPLSAVAGHDSWNISRDKSVLAYR